MYSTLDSGYRALERLLRVSALPQCARRVARVPPPETADVHGAAGTRGHRRGPVPGASAVPVAAQPATCTQRNILARLAKISLKNISLHDGTARPAPPPWPNRHESLCSSLNSRSRACRASSGESSRSQRSSSSQPNDARPPPPPPPPPPPRPFCGAAPLARAPEPPRPLRAPAGGSGVFELLCYM